MSKEARLSRKWFHRWGLEPDDHYTAPAIAKGGEQAAVCGGDTFVEPGKGDDIRAGLGGVHVKNGDLTGSGVKSTHRRYMRDVQFLYKTALVKMGDDQAVIPVLEGIQA